MTQRRVSSKSIFLIVLILCAILCSPFTLSVASENNQVPVLKVTASSDGTQTEKWPHHPEMVIDGDRYTCWASSANNIIGSWLRFEFKERVAVSGIDVINGWIPRDYPDFFPKNHRAKQITLLFDDGSQETVILKDTNDNQRYLLKERKNSKSIKIQIDKIYESEKVKDPWVTISEISFFQ